MGNKNRVDKIFLVNRDRWFRYVFGMLGDKEDAMDVMQESYLKMKSIITEKSIENLTGYFFLVIRNQCFDELKKRNSFVELSDAQDGELTLNISDEIESKDELQFLKLLLKKLPETQRSVILLKDIEGYSYNEVAKMLDMSKNNIRVNLSIARKKIRKAFKMLRDRELKILK